MRPRLLDLFCGEGGAVLRALVGADWMTERGTFLSVPPAYTEHLGRQLIAHLEVAA